MSGSILKLGDVLLAYEEAESATAVEELVRATPEQIDMGFVCDRVERVFSNLFNASVNRETEDISGMVRAHQVVVACYECRNSTGGDDVLRARRSDLKTAIIDTVETERNKRGDQTVGRPLVAWADTRL